MPLNRNADSWLSPAELGQRILPYRSTYDTNLPISSFHNFLAQCPTDNRGFINIGIPGWLLKEDALKIYELAYFTSGSILELSCYYGLSTSILAQAVKDSGTRKEIISVDIELSCITKTNENLALNGLSQFVDVECKNATHFCRELTLSKRKFSFVFVDHSHTYNSVSRVCRMLPDLLVDGGFCLFHDFNDSKNNDPKNLNYAVSQAVYDGLNMGIFEFYGIFGCAALYRRM